ncbi:MAG: hypothetical protein J6C67_02065 [Muribaculaceae bacterium]|nr:hypothetical protein [Muribaculaceae bacterium]
MQNSNRKSGIWMWVVIALIVATILVATLFYIGWFDTNTHVDSNNGDDVLEQYQITGADADEAGVADWQNADGESLMEEVTDPQPDTETPPSE